jgi:DNA mismatch repair protein MutL
LQAPVQPSISARLQFQGGIAVEANAAIPVARGLENAALEMATAPTVPPLQLDVIPDHGCAPAFDIGDEEPTLASLATLKPLGQIRNSFILAVNEDGLWIVECCDSARCRKWRASAF